jgi:hypothetical protein
LICQKALEKGKTIYLENLDGCCLDLNVVRTHLIELYEALGDYKIIKPEYEDENHTALFMYDIFSLVPSIQIVNSHLTVEQVKDNIIVLYGTGSQLIESAEIDFEDIIVSFTNNNLNIEGDICRFIKKSGLLEMGDNGGQLCLIRSDLENWLNEWKCETNDELAAFLTFHANGHNAGVDHEWVDSGSPGGKNRVNGYMSHGCCIILRDMQKFTPCSFCGSFGNKVYENPLDFVLKTSGDINLKYIKDAIYKKFIE